LIKGVVGVVALGALGVVFVGLRAMRRDILKRLEEGRPLRRKPERKVQTA